MTKDEMRNTIVWFIGATGLTLSNIYELTVLETIFESIYGVAMLLGLVILSLLLIGFVKGNDELLDYINDEIEKNGYDKYIYSNTQQWIRTSFSVLTGIMFAYFGYVLLLTGYIIVSVESYIILRTLKDMATIHKEMENIDNGTKTLDEVLDEVFQPSFTIEED